MLSRQCSCSRLFVDFAVPIVYAEDQTLPQTDTAEDDQGVLDYFRDHDWQSIQARIHDFDVHEDGRNVVMDSYECVDQCIFHVYSQFTAKP